MSHCSSCSGAQRWVEASKATATRPLTLGFLHRQPQRSVCSVQISRWPACQHKTSGVASTGHVQSYGQEPWLMADSVSQHGMLQDRDSTFSCCCKSARGQRPAVTAECTWQRAPGLGPCHVLTRIPSAGRFLGNRRIPVSMSAWGSRRTLHRAMLPRVQQLPASSPTAWCAGIQLHS